MKKRIAIICASVLIATTLTGCGEKTDTEQEAYRQYGINCLENGDYDDAVEAFQKALDQAVGVGAVEIDTCLYKAQAQYMAGDTDGAIETYTALIEYNGSADAYYLRGNLYFATGQNDLAVADYESAVKSDSSNYEIYIGIYESLNRYGMTDKGQEYLNKALAIKGDEGQDKMQKGRIYALQGDYDNAVSNLSAAIEAGVNKANFYLGQVYSQMGDKDSSSTYFQAYIDSGEADSYDLCEMGELQMNSGDYDTAVSFFNAALALDSVPNLQKVMKNLIIAYEYSGDFASARSTMEDYMDSYPNDTTAKDEYTFLLTR